MIPAIAITNVPGSIASAPANATFALTSATTSLALCYVPDEDGLSLSAFSLYLSAASGSNIVGGICGDTGGNPDSANMLATATLASPVVNTYNTWTLSTPYALTRGTKYWIVIKGNAAAGPTISYVSGSHGGAFAVGGDSSIGSFSTKTTTTDPTGWSAGATVGRTGPLLHFADGRVDGMNIGAYNIQNMTTPNLYVGNELTVPRHYPLLQVTNFSILTRRDGSSPGTIDCRVYEGSVQIAAAANTHDPSTWTASTYGWRSFTFSPAVVLQPGKTYRFVFATGANATGANYIRRSLYENFSTTIQQRQPLNPKYCVLNAGTWTVTADESLIYGLGLEFSREFPPFPLNRRQFNTMR